MKIVNDNLIKKWEKLRLKAYLPTSKDKWTIGWGHTSGVYPGMMINEAKAQELFEQDTNWVEKTIADLVKVPLNQNQYDSIASLIFNIGRTNFSKSTLLRKLNAKDYEGAAHQFLVWNKQGVKTLSGLVKRRADEMGVFLSAVDGETGVPDTPKGLKPLVASKEAVGGSLVALLASIGVALPEFTKGHSTAILWTVVGIGVLVVANRIYARVKGQR